MQQRVTTIKGERVLLRPLQESDLEESLRVWTPELRRMYGGSLTSERRPTMEDKRRWFETVREGKKGHCFAIEADGRYIGIARLEVADEQSQRARFSIGIANSAYWGRGYGTAVTRLMLRYAFEHLGLHRVELRVAAYNVRAIRCYENCGFRHEGVERHSFFVDGKWHDDVLMAILREEWEAMAACSSDGMCSLGPEHVEEALALWTEVGLWPHPGEDRQSAAAALARNRHLSCGWRVSGKLVGTAVGAWDGLRGWIYRVAVHPDYRRQGIASELVAEVERRLANEGARQINLMVLSSNTAAWRLYARLGYEPSKGSVMRKRLGALNRQSTPQSAT
jgi:RimJ/RimL family protein N-acetyltransferase